MVGCVCPAAGHGVLRRRLGHRSDQENQEKHAERTLDRLHLPGNPQGERPCWQPVIDERSNLRLCGTFALIQPSRWNQTDDSSCVSESVFWVCSVCFPPLFSAHLPWYNYYFPNVKLENVLGCELDIAPDRRGQMRRTLPPNNIARISGNRGFYVFL